MRTLSIQRCIDTLVHTSECHDANCRWTSCHEMKCVVIHTKVCKRKTNGECAICTKLLDQCGYHAKHCQEAKCPVPFCSEIKHKRRLQQLHQTLQQARLLKGRMAVMNTRAAASANPTASRNMLLTSSVASVCIQAGGLKFDTQTPPANVLQGVKQVEEETTRQQVASEHMQRITPFKHPMSPVFTYSSVQPQSKASSGSQPGPESAAQNQPEVPLAPFIGGNLLPMDQWPRYTGPTTQNVRQADPRLTQSSGQLASGHMQSTNQLRQPISQAFTSTNANSRQALLQLMTALKSPQTHEQQQHILQILKSNPQLMAAFMKYKQKSASVCSQAEGLKFGIQTPPANVLRGVKQVEKETTGQQVASGHMQPSTQIKHHVPPAFTSADADSEWNDGSSSCRQTKVNSQDARELSTKGVIQSLVCVGQCGDANCRLTNCSKA